MVSVAQRLDRRFHDMVGRPEIGLPDTEIDDIPALIRQRGRPGQNGEGVFLADAVEVGDGFEHVCCLSDRVGPGSHHVPWNCSGPGPLIENAFAVIGDDFGFEKETFRIAGQLR